MPLGVFLELCAAGLVARRTKRARAARWLLFVAFALLVVCSSPFTAHAFATWLESGAGEPDLEALPRADAIVVLGGAVSAALPPRLHPELVDASDRVLHAARLFRAGKAPLVVASGGRSPLSQAQGSEAEEMAGLLMEWGVPSASLVEERRSTTTRENALECRQLLAGRGVESILLVTSAAHMRRALATFRRAGLEATPAPTDFNAVGTRPPLYTLLLPHAGALSAVSQCWQEVLARLYYRLRGWA